jgi:UDP:flavonoid glycosyltransferase YjiC (YdhE family)
MVKRRILLTTLGSYGDLHPYIAIALGLLRRGHAATLASSPFYREKIESAGVPFHPLNAFAFDEITPELIRKLFDPIRGPEFLIRDCIMPALENAWSDTVSGAEGADLLVSHPLTFATQLVAEKFHLPWASVSLAPMSFFSRHNPPVLAPAPGLWRILGPSLLRWFLSLGKVSTVSWVKPYHRLRKELGLPPAPNPLFEGSFSPYLILAIFSRELATPDPDWPAQAVITGFPFYDNDGSSELSPEIEDFLNAGPAPLVFTLGSSAVLHAGHFYTESAKAARLLNKRAVLLVGKDTANRPTSLPPEIGVFDYAPYSQLFPRAAAIVHQGGVGTTGQAMRAGRPMLVMPFGFDQQDNAYRVEKRGIAQTISRKKYSAETAAAALRKLFDDPKVEDRAASVGAGVRGENGVESACDHLEQLLH